MHRNPFMASAMLALEAQQVIGLRLAKLALGGQDAAEEVQLMMDEKMTATADAAQLLTTAAMTGRAAAGPDEVVTMLRNRVRANRNRLLG